VDLAELPLLENGDHVTREEFERRHEGQYVPLVPDDDGIIRSHVFPGLQLAVDALLAGDMAEKCWQPSDKDCKQRNIRHLFSV
jgi:hypothetical protein